MVLQMSRRVWFRVSRAVQVTLILLCLPASTGLSGEKTKAESQSSVPSSVQATSNFSEAEQMFDRVRELLKEQYVDENLSDDALFRAAVSGMLAHLDPKSQDWNKLLTPQEYTDMLTELEGNVVGIGVEISLDAATGYVYVDGVIPNTPAANAGLKVGSQILKIEDQVYKGKTLLDVIHAVRGKPGTQVHLSVLQDAKVQEMKIKREALQWETVGFKQMPGDLALLTIKSFTAATPKALVKALQQVRAAKSTGVILDLRGNSGGALEQTLASIKLLVPTGSIMVKKQGRGLEAVDVLADGTPILGELPMVVLMDKETRSGAEFMAAALRHNLHATLLGTATFGKWSAQKVEQLPNGYAIKYTVAKFLTPDGEDPMGKGLSPDISVAQDSVALLKLQRMSDFKQRLELDSQLKAALNVLELQKGG